MPHGDHHHDHRAAERGFAPGIALNLALIAAEVAAGLLAGSVALLADAVHNLSDVLGLGLAWGAARLARRPPTPRRSWGWARAGILAALLNAVLLLAATAGIAWEAAWRLADPLPVASGPVAAVALVAAGINFGTAWLLAAGREADVNRRGAYLHMLADAGVSVGVAAGAGLVAVTGWLWLDPALALLIAGLVAYGGWDLLREATDLALDAAPRGVDPAAVRAFLLAQPGVAEVHALHVWAPGTARVALSAHLLRPGAGPDDGFLTAVRHALQARFGIAHVTLQVEAGDPANPCAEAPSAAHEHEDLHHRGDGGQNQRDPAEPPRVRHGAA